LEGVFGCPLKDGEEVLKSKDELDRGCLVLELPKGIIWEKGLFEGVLERLEEWLRGWNGHSVHALCVRICILFITHL